MSEMTEIFVNKSTDKPEDLSSKVYTIQVDYGNPHYKVAIKDNKAYIYIYTKSNDLYELKGYIDFKELLVDLSNPTALLLKTDDNRYVYIGHKIFTIAGKYMKFVKFVCLKRGDFNIPYGLTTENNLYGFTENLALNLNFLDTKFDNYFDLFHILTLKNLDYAIMSNIYKEEIFDDSFYDEGVKPYKFSEDEIVNLEFEDKKIEIKEGYLKINDQTYELTEIFIRDNTILALIGIGERGFYKYLFVNKKKQYTFISYQKILKYVKLLDEKGCHFAYTRINTFFCFERDELQYIRSDLNPEYFIKIAHLYNFAEQIVYKPSTDPTKKFIPNLYYTHDNGGRPFRVTVNRKNKKVKIEVSKYNEDKDEVTWNQKYNLDYINIFIGENDDEEQDLITGSSILIQIKKDTYILVSDSIIEFKTKDQIKEFYSRAGGSDTFQPYAISDKNFYFFFTLDDGVVAYDKKSIKKRAGLYDLDDIGKPAQKLKFKTLVERL